MTKLASLGYEIRRESLPTIERNVYVTRYSVFRNGEACFTVLGDVVRYRTYSGAYSYVMRNAG